MNNRRHLFVKKYSGSIKDNSYSLIRHKNGYFYIQRRKNSFEDCRKIKKDLRKTRKNISILKRLNSDTDQRALFRTPAGITEFFSRIYDPGQHII